MKLSRFQKKFLKKNLRKISLSEIAEKFGFSEEELQTYLKSTLPKEKYQKLIAGKQKEKNAKQNSGALVFLIFLVLALYFNSLGNEFLSDDIPAILENKYIGNLSYCLTHQPLNFLRYFFYFFAYKIGGLNPLPYRLLNIFFHLGSVLTIYALISLLSSGFLALIVASLFAVHPVLTESVTWISGGIHTQYAFFLLLSFLFYLLARFLNWQKKYYLFSIISFVFALLTSEKAAILPLILSVFELSQGQLRKYWLKLIPFFFFAGIWVFSILFTGLPEQRTTALETSYYQEGGLYNPLLQIPVAISSYLSLIFWPEKLSFYHSEMSYSLTQYILKLFLMLSFFTIIIFTFIKKKYRQIFFWLSFFVISLFPMLTPFKVAWVVAERYVYLGTLGILVVAGMGIKKIGEITKNKKSIYLLMTIILLALSARTIIRNIDWKNQDNLWLATAKTSPSSPQNHNNLGDLYGRRGEYEKAIEEFKNAIELKPNYADAYHNLANTYHQIGKDEFALENYQKALEFNPNLWQSHLNLAAIYFNQGKIQEAKEELEKAITVNPQNAGLYVNLALVYQKLGEKDKANQVLQKAQQLLSLP